MTMAGDNVSAYNAPPRRTQSYGHWVRMGEVAGMSDRVIEFLEVGTPPNGRAIAVQASSGGTPGVVWLGGFKSDMMGTKAEALAAWAKKAGRACVRFDYSGNGQSKGQFTDGTIGRWLEESL